MVTHLHLPRTQPRNRIGDEARRFGRGRRAENHRHIYGVHVRRTDERNFSASKLALTIHEKRLPCSPRQRRLQVRSATEDEADANTYRCFARRHTRHPQKARRRLPLRDLLLQLCQSATDRAFGRRSVVVGDFWQGRRPRRVLLEVRSQSTTDLSRISGSLHMNDSALVALRVSLVR